MTPLSRHASDTPARPGDGLHEVEALLLDRYAAPSGTDDIPVVFILASPRTGSTLAYQILINRFRVFYFSNFINDCFPQAPIVGAALATHIGDADLVPYESEYGKTAGRLGPSEGSNIFRHWFGGEHPSQVKSVSVLRGMEPHLRSTMTGLYGMTGLPILTKNAWNCFRVRELSRVFPSASYVWVRRDITHSALSDLNARYRRGGPMVWNSATTANYHELQKKPYWQQVVEQQYEYNLAIGHGLEQFARGRYVEIWYEDLCADPATQCERLYEQFATKSFRQLARSEKPVPRFEPSSVVDYTSREDSGRVLNYVKGNANRFEPYVYMQSVPERGGWS